MDSSQGDDDSKIGSDGLEGFDDFTVASSWERLISGIEAVIRMWQSDGVENLLVKGATTVEGSRNLHSINAEISYGIQAYILEYFFSSHSNPGCTDCWEDGLHFLQLWFGINDFLIFSPKSMSRVILDVPEGTRLLSAVAIALSNCGSELPAFVPVHDPSRKSYKGIQSMRRCSRRFEVDHIGSQVPVKMMHLEGLYELFVSKLAFVPLDFSSPSIQVHYTMRLTYQTVVADSEHENNEVSPFETSEANVRTEDEIFKQIHWDDEFPWSEWYSAEDPIKGFELITLWLDRVVASSIEMAELENASVFEADKWFLLPLIYSYRFDAFLNDAVSFASRLSALIAAYIVSFEAKYTDDFVTAERAHIQNITKSAIVPPPTVLDRVLKDLFQEGPTSTLSMGAHEFARGIKGAPVDSLFTKFCLHSLWFGSCNIRAIAVLWTEFMREVRWCWEELLPLPRMPNEGNIDLSCCLVYQKLHMLSLCINKKASVRKKHQQEVTADNADNSKRMDEGNAHQFDRDSEEQAEDHSMDVLHSERGRPSIKLGAYLSNGIKSVESSLEIKSITCDRKGSAGPAGNLMLLKKCKSLHAPLTQDIPLMTQDMHEERQQAIEALSNSLEGKNMYAQLEQEILASDMSAFKAANPQSVFEDFIRWHSPVDWIENHANETSGNGWPPRGHLSERMSEPGNSWRQIWDKCEAIPASEQRPLFDPDQEGEKILHYLETLRPHQLLGQMICTAFRGAAELLSKTDVGKSQQLNIRIEQLYRTIASSLKSLQWDQMLDDADDFNDDMKKLCSVFEETENLIVFAASLHKKIQHCARLEACIFNDHVESIQRAKQRDEKVTNSKQFVRAYERMPVSELFPSPSLRQSWRKVLTMGNQLNGHEPLSREVVFSFHDKLDDRHYGIPDGEISSSTASTHSMYIRGTSNDLRVAFAATCSD